MKIILTEVSFMFVFTIEVKKNWCECVCVIDCKSGVYITPLLTY